MAKKKVERPKGKPTKRQLSRWQQQKRRQRVIISIGVSVIAVAVGLVVAGIYYGWYLPEQKPLKQTVIEVNGTQFNMDYYIEALEYHAGGQSAQYIEFLLEPVLESIKHSELIRQEALELGITISDKEVEEELNSRNLPRNQAVSAMVRTQLLLERLRQEYFGLQVPLSTEQRYIMAMLLESQSQAAEVKAKLDDSEDFAQLAGELSLDSLTKENNGDLGWRPKGVLAGLLDTSLLDDYAFGSEVGVVSQPLHDEGKTKSLGYWLIQVLERREEGKEAHVQAMLLASREEAWDIRSRLEAGEDFGQLATSFSHLPGVEEDNGDLGWVTKSDASQAFADFVFDSETELSIMSEPIGDETIDTKGGYWLFKVLDEAIREIYDEDRELLVTKILDDWLAALMDDPESKVISYLDSEMKAFAARKARAS